MKRANNVEEYITEAPKEVQGKLRELRAVIKEEAPQAEEKLSYGMPYYGYNGRLVYFAYAKNHVGLYVMPPIIENHAEALREYVTAKATVQFPLEKDLPMPLIRMLIKAGIKQNEERQ